MGSKKEGSSKGKKKAFFEANGESGNLLKICVFWIVLGKKKNWWKNRFLVFCNLSKVKGENPCKRFHVTQLSHKNVSFKKAT